MTLIWMCKRKTDKMKGERDPRRIKDCPSLARRSEAVSDDWKLPAYGLQGDISPSTRMILDTLLYFKSSEHAVLW